MPTKKTYKMHPFTYGFDDKQEFINFWQQRNAQYRESAEEVFNNKNLDDKELNWDTFRNNTEAPTPQIKRIDGYDSEEKASGESDETTEGGDNETPDSGE